MTQPAPERRHVFISYCRVDRAWVERIRQVMAPLLRQDGNNVQLWDDGQIQPGENWLMEIETALARAQVALLLVSAEFLASEFVMGKEVPALLRAAEFEGVTILWVALSPCLVQHTAIHAFQAVLPPEETLDAMGLPQQRLALVRIAEAVHNAQRQADELARQRHEQTRLESTRREQEDVAAHRLRAAEDTRQIDKEENGLEVQERQDIAIAGITELDEGNHNANPNQNEEASASKIDKGTIPQTLENAATLSTRSCAGSLGDIFQRVFLSAKERKDGCTLPVLFRSGKELHVQIPAGVRNGQKIRLLGQGHLDKQLGRTGDLYLVVSDSNYARLSSMLEGGHWQYADCETYELLIRSVGKEPYDWFSTEDLLRIPCEVLCSVEDLWVKNSKGRFGFGKQKALYLACGGTLDGEYPGQLIDKLFLQEVGWPLRNKKIYMDANVTKQPRLPYGCVKRNWIWEGGILCSTGESVGYWSLFKRIHECGL